MIRHKLYILLFLVLIPVMGFTQEINDYIKAAEKEYAAGNYYAAVDLYEKVIDINKNIKSIHYNLAEAYRLNRDYKNAEKWYRRVRRDNPEKYPLADFWYGKMLKSQGQYLKASKAFKRFYKKNRNNPLLEESIYKSKYERDLCLSLSEEIPIAPNIKIVHLDTSINSIYGEFSPVEIDSTVFYSTYREFGDSGSESFKSRMLTYNGIINSVTMAFDSLFYDDNYHYALSSIGENGNIYFTKCPLDTATDYCKIYNATLKEGKLSKVKQLNSVINPGNSNSRHPSFANFNGKDYLVFSSDRAGGVGGYDIWYSIKNSNGEFADCINAGTKINSRENEVTPFYFAKDTVLYFSSSWHNSLGGYDIFSALGDFDYWESPDNIGSPINSSYDDLYYNFHHDSKQAYFVSNRKGSYTWSNETCCNDIYTFKLPYSLNDTLRAEAKRKKKIEKLIRIEKNLKLLTPLDLFFNNDTPDPGSKDSLTNSNINILLAEYLNQRETIISEFTNGIEESELEESINLVNEFFFDEVEKGLDDLQLFIGMMEELLNNGKPITITLKAYSSPLNSKTYNEQLAKRRINSLINYLELYNNGIFIQYINSGQLSITQLAIGELNASSDISDDINDIRNSVYNPTAARERKITIIAVTLE